MNVDANNHGPVRFGAFEFDHDSGELRKRGLQVRLTPQATMLLRVLLETPWGLRTREELQQRIWPSQSYLDFEHGLNKIVHSLREALGDTGNNPRFIETVAAKGYHFILESLQSSAHSTKGLVRDNDYSVAVLPIETASNDPEVMFLSRRITSAFIDALAMIHGLRVVSEGTVKSRITPGADPQQAGKRMGVQAVFAGELVLHDAVLFLRTELIEVSDGTHLAGARAEKMFCSAQHLDEDLVNDILGQLQPVLAAVTCKLTSN